MRGKNKLGYSMAGSIKYTSLLREVYLEEGHHAEIVRELLTACSGTVGDASQGSLAR